jgi:hypothetical protein
MMELRLPVPNGMYEMVYKLPLGAMLVATMTLAGEVMLPAEVLAGEGVLA